MDTVLVATMLALGTTFVHLLVEVIPFFMVGVLTGALVQTYASPRLTARLLGGSGLRALSAAVAAGAILPGCACTTAPMARGLRGTGAARLGTVAAFIVVSPLLSPTTVVLTWGVLGWKMTLARVVASIAGALVLGAIVLRFEAWFLAGEFPAEQGSEECCDDLCGCAPEEADARPPFWSGLWDILRETVPYFLLGMLVASLLTSFLPEDAIPRWLGSASGVWAYMLAVVVGIPLYVCEGEEVPLTLGLVSVGLGAGPALAFLLGSVGTCIPTAIMAQSIIGKRATAFYLAFWFVFAVASGVLFQLMQG